MKIFTFAFFHRLHIVLLLVSYLFICMMYLQMGFSVWFVHYDQYRKADLMIGVVKICSNVNCEIYPKDLSQNAMLGLSITCTLLATMTFGLSASALCFIKAHAAALVSAILSTATCLAMGILTTYQYHKYLDLNLYMPVNDTSLVALKSVKFDTHNFPVSPFHVLIYISSFVFLALSICHGVTTFYVYHEHEEEF